VSWLLFLLAFVIDAGALSLRHAWFQTGAWDLAIFDQAVALIGQGAPAQSSLLGFHILGDHGALVLYPLGWLSRWLPSPGLLIAVQAAALAGAVFPLAQLARLRGLSRHATAVSLAVLLLYPVVFNTAIFDFHPDVLAVPLVMQALVWLERRGPADGWRVLAVLLLALTCKLSLVLLVLGLGLSLLLERRRLALPLIALALGWLLLVGGWLMPAFGGEEARLLRHAGKFGADSMAAAPLAAMGSLLGQLVSLASLEYLLLLVLPVLYVLLHRQRRRFLRGLLPFAPLLLLNLLAARPALKDLVHHYSLLLVPFLAAGVQQTLAPGPAGQGGYPAWMGGRLPALVLAWALLWFLLLSRLGFYFGTFQQELGHAPQLRAAIALVRPDVPLLSSPRLAPHLAHRPILAIPSRRELQRLDRYEQVLLDGRHAGSDASPELVRRIRRRLSDHPLWQLRFAEEDVWLFERRSPADPDTVLKSRQQ
jgi:hypothetical protein